MACYLYIPFHFPSSSLHVCYLSCVFRCQAWVQLLSGVRKTDTESEWAWGQGSECNGWAVMRSCECYITLTLKSAACLVLLHIDPHQCTFISFKRLSTSNVKLLHLVNLLSIIVEARILQKHVQVTCHSILLLLLYFHVILIFYYFLTSKHIFPKICIIALFIPISITVKIKYNKKIKLVKFHLSIN